jgi:hypothetical protein
MKTHQIKFAVIVFFVLLAAHGSSIPYFVTRAIAIQPPAAPCIRGTFRSSRDPIPPNWPGPVFELSQSYPDSLPAAEEYPWKGINFEKNPMAYMMAVRRYVYEGNVDAGNPNKPWVVQKNPRPWYHAPWLDAGQNRREFIHGLTRELPSVPGQLWDNPPQKSDIQNWAVGFYNTLGGYVIGQVWCDPQKPSLSPVLFPEGTVSAKLLFSAAPLSEVPFLWGAVQWTANINEKPLDTNSPRKPTIVRLLQIDIAVRDDDNKLTGWNFGTFIYNPDGGSKNPWENMQPVGFMWGNDPDVTPTNGKPIKQSWLNPKVAHLMRHYGWARRLNGPVDNPLSSCLSCHSTAGWPRASLAPPTGATNTERLKWFRNIPAGGAFESNQVSHDYSLQLTSGIRQFNDEHPGGLTPQLLHLRALKTTPKPGPEVNRAGKSEAEFRRETIREMRRIRRSRVRR